MFTKNKLSSLFCLLATITLNLSATTIDSREQALETLGLHGNPDEQAIKKKFKNLALKCHPDKVKDKEERFKDISAAHKYLIETPSVPRQRPPEQPKEENLVKIRATLSLALFGIQITKSIVERWHREYKHDKKKHAKKPKEFKKPAKSFLRHVLKKRSVQLGIATSLGTAAYFGYTKYSCSTPDEKSKSVPKNHPDEMD